MKDAGSSRARLFFAALPDPATRERFAASAEFVQRNADTRLVPAVNYHMTLAFIGDVTAAMIPAIEAIGATQRSSAFALRFDAYEYWPKPEVLVAAARTIPGSLEHLWRDLHRDLAAREWALDPKRLRPHVTLARKVSQAPVLQAMSPFDWTVDRFHLMRSDTGGLRSAYTVVATWPLLYDSEKT